jgi:hypothetical protein
MSKDKGTKNHKKSPADKTSGKGKEVSAYKSESKSGQDIIVKSNAPKPDQKQESGKKK